MPNDPRDRQDPHGTGFKRRLMDRIEKMHNALENVRDAANELEHLQDDARETVKGLKPLIDANWDDLDSLEENINNVEEVIDSIPVGLP